MPENKNIINLDRISLLAATIMLAYTLLGFVDIPSREIALQLPGVYFEITINVQIIIAILVAGLTATGADGLVRSNPSFKGGLTIQHWLLPALTAWAIGIILFQQPFGPLWWIVFVTGSAVLILVLAAEYIVVDTEGTRRIPATIGITGISFALFLTLAITIHAIETRLFIFVPALSAAFLLTNLRVFHLRLQGDWAFSMALVNTILIGQISAALHYLPIDPITFGLLILGLAYALTDISSGFLEKKEWRKVVTEPIIALSIIWGIAFYFR